VGFHELMRLREERGTSGVTRGQADLVESPAKVRRFQEATQGKLEEFRERIQPTKEKSDVLLKKLFPELRKLRKSF
jgi:hypothetical protein